MFEIVVGVVVLVVGLFVVFKLLLHFFPKIFGNGIRLTTVERSELKVLEKESYLQKAKELAVKRGELKAGEDYNG